MAARLLSLESPWSHDFDDVRLEWRRLFSEFLGTFLLVLAGAGGAVVDAASGGQIRPGRRCHGSRPDGDGDDPLHGRRVRRTPEPRRDLLARPAGRYSVATGARVLPGYIVVQLVGAVTAVLLLKWIFGDVGGPGATLPGTRFTDWQAVGVEFLLTLGLLSVILGTASTAQNVGPLSALGVGGYIVLAGLWSSPVSGASMNPARSFGPALVSGDFSAYWVYLVGPFLGGAVAVGVAILLRGRGGDAGGRAAARGGSRCRIHPDALTERR